MQSNAITTRVAASATIARISNIYNSGINKKGINIIAGVETVTLYFSEDVDLSSQISKLSNKVNEINQKLNGLRNKIKNKSFLKNAPKLIIDKEKKSLINYSIELKKLNSILNSIKN